jgi:hypothetical protein
MWRSSATAEHYAPLFLSRAHHQNDSLLLVCGLTFEADAIQFNEGHFAALIRQVHLQFPISLIGEALDLMLVAIAVDHRCRLRPRQGHTAP